MVSAACGHLRRCTLAGRGWPNTNCRNTLAINAEVHSLQMGWRELAVRRVDDQRDLRRATEAERDLALRRIDGSGIWERQTSQGAIKLSGYPRATKDLAGLP